MGSLHKDKIQHLLAPPLSFPLDPLELPQTTLPWRSRLRRDRWVGVGRGAPPPVAYIYVVFHTDQGSLSPNLSAKTWEKQKLYLSSARNSLLNGPLDPLGAPDDKLRVK